MSSRCIDRSIREEDGLEGLALYRLRFVYAWSRSGQHQVGAPVRPGWNLTPNGTWQTGWNLYPDNTLTVQVDGSTEIETSLDTTRHLKPGDCMFIPTGVWVRVTCHPLNGVNTLHSTVFRFTCLDSIDFLSLFAVQSHYTGESARRLRELVFEFDRVQQATALSATRREVKTQQAAFALLDVLMEHSEFNAEKGKLLARHTRLMPVLRRMHESPETVTSVEEVAEALNMSRSQAFRVFKRLIGHGPTEYLRAQRLRKASMLILTTDLSIGEVADKLAYPNQFSFSKAFKKQFGVAPSQYRTVWGLVRH